MSKTTTAFKFNNRNLLFMKYRKGRGKVKKFIKSQNLLG